MTGFLSFNHLYHNLIFTNRPAERSFLVIDGWGYVCSEGYEEKALHDWSLFEYYQFVSFRVVYR